MGWSNAGWRSDQGGWYKNAAAASPTFSLTLTDSAPSGATGTSVNYGTLNYGAGNTRVIVALQWTYAGSGQTVTGVTVGGTALAQISGAFNNGTGVSGNTAIDVWMSSAPLAGSSGAVVVTLSASMPFSSSAAIYNLVTTTPTPVTPVIAVDPNKTFVSGSITVPAGGGAIALVAGSNGPTLSSFTNVTVDATVTPTARLYYYGHTNTTGAITTTATFGATDQLSLTLVAWSP